MCNISTQTKQHLILSSTFCSSDEDGPRSSSSTTGLSSLNESTESLSSIISEESSTGFHETENGMCTGDFI